MASAVPFLVDPIGAATGVPFSPGGAVKNAITPKLPKAGQPAQSSMAEPPQAPKISITGGGTAPKKGEAPTGSGDGRTGAGAGADATRGLLASRGRRTLLS